MLINKCVSVEVKEEEQSEEMGNDRNSVKPECRGLLKMLKV